MKNNNLKHWNILGIIGALILLFTLSSCAMLGLSTAKKVEATFLAAEKLQRQEHYGPAIEKYLVAREEFGKPGVTIGLRPYIDASFPTLVNRRIGFCYSKAVEQLFLAGEKSYQQMDYEEAIKKYKVALKTSDSLRATCGSLSFGVPYIDQDFPVLANYNIARSYSEFAEQSEDSKVLYSMAIVYASRAATYLNSGQKYKAESYHFWGDLLHKTREPEQAIQRFSEVVKYFPESPLVEEASYRIGVFYHGQKNYELSLRAFKRILDKFPSSRFKHEAHYRIGEVFLERANYGQAYQEFTRLLDSPIHLHDFHEDALYHTAYCLYRLDRQDGALRRYTEFTRRYPKSQYAASARFALGEICWKKKNFTKALANYKLALRNTKDRNLKSEIRAAIAATHFAMGRMYFGRKDYKKALSNYELALQNAEKRILQIEVQLAMAFAHFNQGDAKNTLATCRRLLANAEQRRNAMVKIGKLAEVRLTIANGVQLYLDAENAVASAGYSKAAFKYHSAILRVLEGISTPAGVEYQEELTYILGDLFYKTEQFESAEQELTKIVEDFPDSNFVDDAWYVIGEINYKLQSYLECRRAFRKVLDGFPNSDLRDDAQYFIAKSLLEELKYEHAYLEFDQLTRETFQKYPDFQDDTLYHAAYCLNQLRRYDEAILQYAAFIERYPKSFYCVDAYFDLGIIYARQQDYINARRNYALAMQHTDDLALRAEIQMAIGRAYYDQGEYKNAIGAHTTLLKKYPESDFIVEAKLEIANSHFRMESWREAAGAYERVIHQHPESTNFLPYCAYQIGEAHYGLAAEYNEQGKTALAVENFHSALEWYQKVLDDFLTEVSEDLSEIVGLLITSLTRMRSAHGVPEELQSQAQLKIGDTYLSVEQYAKALAEYNTFVQAFSDSSSGAVQDRIKQVQEAIISNKLQQKQEMAVAQVPIAQQIARKALASTVLIRIKDAIGEPLAVGSGFFISADQIVTNWHVVDDAISAYAIWVDRETKEQIRYDIEGFTAMNPKQDLVILKVSPISASRIPQVGKPLPLGNSNIVQIGEPIYVTGNPEGWTGTFSTGTVSGIQLRYAGKRLQITAPVSPGSSGGPVLNDKGEVIGIVYAIHGGPNAQNLNLAIPVNYLKALLKRVRPPMPLSTR